MNTWNYSQLDAKCRLRRAIIYPRFDSDGKHFGPSIQERAPLYVGPWRKHRAWVTRDLTAWHRANSAGTAYTEAKKEYGGPDVLGVDA